MAESNPALKKGSKGEAVRRLQETLQQLGLGPGAVDGVFGAQTEKAVKQYQTDAGLVTDGVVGEKTWAALEQAC